MFGWLRPRPPLGAREKAWTETRLQRLVELLGVEHLQYVKMVLPTDEPLTQRENDARAEATALAAQIRASFPARIAIPELPCDPGTSEAACEPGCSSCPEGTTAADEGTGRDSQTAVAELVHAMARAALVNLRYPAASDGDLGSTAELLSMLVGYGVVCANTAQSRRTLPARVWGYALALFAHARREIGADWSTYLHPDPQVHFQTGLRYLRRGGESLFDPAGRLPQAEPRSIGQLIHQLSSGTPSARIAAIWELPYIGSQAAEALPQLLDYLHARDADLRSEAAGAIGGLGRLTPEIQERLIDALHDQQEPVRAAAARALGRLRASEEDVIRELAEALLDDSALVGARANEALASIGPAAHAALPALLLSFRGALVSCNDRRALELAAAIKTVAPNGESCIMEFLEEQDQDLRHAALDVLQQAGPRLESDGVVENRA